MARCQYSNKEVKIHDYESRDPKTACFYYGLLTNISEIKHNVGIDIGIVPKISGFNKQRHDYQHTLWARALAIYGQYKLTLV